MSCYREVSAPCWWPKVGGSPGGLQAARPSLSFSLPALWVSRSALLLPVPQALLSAAKEMPLHLLPSHQGTAHSRSRHTGALAGLRVLALLLLGGTTLQLICSAFSLSLTSVMMLCDHKGQIWVNERLASRKSLTIRPVKHHRELLLTHLGGDNNCMFC